MHIGEAKAMADWHGGARADRISHFAVTTMPPSTRHRDALLGATIALPQFRAGLCTDGLSAGPAAAITVQTHVGGAIWKGLSIAAPAGLTFWIFIIWLLI